MSASPTPLPATNHHHHHHQHNNNNNNNSSNNPRRITHAHIPLHSPSATWLRAAMARLTSLSGYCVPTLWMLLLLFLAGPQRGVLSLSAASEAGACAIIAGGLSVEYMQPAVPRQSGDVGVVLGVGAALPRLSWLVQLVQPGARNQTLSAYQIIVTDAPGGGATVWDSGRVASPNSVAIEYGGLPLSSRQGVLWKVQVCIERELCSHEDGLSHAFVWQDTRDVVCALGVCPLDVRSAPWDWQAKHQGYDLC